MKIERRVIFLFFIIASLIQSFQLIPSVHEEYPNWAIPFLLMVSISQNPSISSLVTWYIGFATISFFVLGSIKEKVHGYGKYIIVRNYSKTKFILNELFKVSAWVTVLILTQFLVFYLFSLFTNIKTVNHYWDFTVLAKPLTLYILCSIGLVLIQMALELYFSSITSFLLVNCYVALSISLWNYLSYIGKGHQMIYLGIANYMMALRTDAFIDNAFSIKQNIAFIFIILIIGLTILIAKKRMKELDIH